MSTLIKLISARRALTSRLPAVLSRSYHDDGVYGYRVRKEYQLQDCEYISYIESKLSESIDAFSSSYR